MHRRKLYSYGDWPDVLILTAFRVNRVSIVRRETAPPPSAPTIQELRPTGSVKYEYIVVSKLLQALPFRLGGGAMGLELQACMAQFAIANVMLCMSVCLLLINIIANSDISAGY